MNKNSSIYKTYVEILQQELVPAMGCTEPIAISYCSAKARSILGAIPDRVLVEVSGNIIKNVKSVIVPNTNGLKGIEAAAAAGIIAGDADKVLEVISSVTDSQKAVIKKYMDEAEISVRPLTDGALLDIIITLFKGNDKVKVRIADYHTNIVYIEKNGEVLYNIGLVTASEAAHTPDKGLLTVDDIIAFAESADLADVAEILARQIEYNSKIAAEGLKNDWGANIGSVLLKTYGNDVKIRARAMAAAGSDARMSGCELPVIINSGSGNQGMTASLPVIEYAKELQASEEKLYRALIISNLITIHLKTGIGPLSAYCGAVSAGCGAGCGIAYLYGGGRKEIAHTLVNAIAIVSGIVCDGAKPSCAGKIAAAVDAGILGYHMYKNGQQFRGGDGIVSKGVENTINNVGRLGSRGMKETDAEILRIMTDC
jgi:L-cysteine desulfidase